MEMRSGNQVQTTTIPERETGGFVMGWNLAVRGMETKKEGKKHIDWRMKKESGWLEKKKDGDLVRC